MNKSFFFFLSHYSQFNKFAKSVKNYLHTLPSVDAVVYRIPPWIESVLKILGVLGGL